MQFFIFTYFLRMICSVIYFLTKCVICNMSNASFLTSYLFSIDILVVTQLKFSYLLKFSIGCCTFREEIVTAVRTQREKFELTVPAKPKARECADLLLLSIYVFIPPSRGLEIRTLEVVGEEESLEARKDTARNLLIQMANGDIRLHFSNFKTRKFVGRDELALGVSW